MRRRRDPARVLVGALLGALAGLVVGPRFAAPEPVDPQVFNVLVPGLDEDVTAPELGRGTQVHGGALVLTPHAFDRADMVGLRDERPPARIELELEAGSGTLLLQLHPARGTAGSIVPLSLRPDGWTTKLRPNEVHAHGPVYVVTHDSLGVKVDGTVAEVASGRSPGAIELTTAGEEAALRSLRAWDASGVPIVDVSWEAQPFRPFDLLFGAGIGAVAGLAWALGPLPAMVALVVPAMLIATVSHQAWLAAVERLYLVRTAPWVLAQACLAASFLPLVALVLLRAGVLVPPERRRRELPVWVHLAALLGAAVVASRELHGWERLWTLPGALFLAAPLRLAVKGRFGVGGTMARDLPALVAVAALGWGLGLLPAVLWRLLVLAASATRVLERAPGPGADTLFALIVCLPLATEVAVRATWLGTAWDAARLSEGSGSWKTATPWWSGRCGDGDAKNLYFFGGSSVGGAYQMRWEPEGFFAARAHASLCGTTTLRTWNFGDGGRDSFTISRALATYVQGGAPDVAVLYLGVNDLLTQNSSLTRKEREALEAARGDATTGIAALAARSRLVSGIGLAFRAPPEQGGARVPDVPIADAEENIRRVVAEVAAAGGHVVLAPELTDTTTARQLGAYRALQARLGEELPDATFVDLVAIVGSDPELLVDRNHLSRRGHERVAEALLPVLGPLLAGP